MYGLDSLTPTAAIPSSADFGGFTAMSPAGAPGSDAALSNGVPGAEGQGNIMGMTPNQFAAVAGGLGAAISPKDSWQQKVGTFAQGLGTTQLAAIANQKKAKAEQKYFEDLLDKYPQLVTAMGSPK